jgi:preprotein translocase subunit SecG
MVTLLVIVYVGVCVALIVSVLLQSSKGEGLAGAFGGGGGTSGAVFGGRGAANFLSRSTTVLAILFMFLAIVLSFLGTGSSGIPGGTSAVQKAAQQPQQSVPVTEVPGAEPVNPAAQDLFDESTDPNAQPAQPDPSETGTGDGSEQQGSDN